MDATLDAQAPSTTSVRPGAVSTAILITFALSLLLFLFRDGLELMVGSWSRAEYSHGYLIPVIAVFLALQRRRCLAALDLRGSWTGPVVVLLGLLGFTVGSLSTIYTVSQYAFLLCLFGLVLAVIGRAGTAALWTALAYLAFMIPLPNFLYVNLSAQLQLLSSELGVAVIRLFNIPVFLEGNVIDLGVYKLQVAEACSGLRYLFPLMSFGFLAGCLYRGPAWQKILLFLSTIPITILMNSVRIGLIGVFVDRWGIGAAEGFLHLFEGWVIFMACLAVLLVEAAVLLRLGGTRVALRDAFTIELPRLALPALGGGFSWRHQGPLLVSLGLLVAAGLSAGQLASRQEILPEHEPFVLIPTQISDWHGREVPLEAEVLSALKLDDYRNIDFRQAGSGELVNFYVAYYASQRQGASAHSPRSCIPGGGWEISSIRQISLDIPGPDGAPLAVNRVLISKGTVRQLVYYWFQQRGRVITNEYLVKWYILLDAMLKHRTDGAMVRLVTPLREGETQSSGDDRLAGFAAAIYPAFVGFIPE